MSPVDASMLLPPTASGLIRTHLYNYSNGPRSAFEVLVIWTGADTIACWARTEESYD
jgi:hypothetical protein